LPPLVLFCIWFIMRTIRGASLSLSLIIQLLYPAYHAQFIAPCTHRCPRAGTWWWC
jgi:hypothetical protein